MPREFFAAHHDFILGNRAWGHAEDKGFVFGARFHAEVLDVGSLKGPIMGSEYGHEIALGGDLQDQKPNQVSGIVDI